MEQNKEKTIGFWKKDAMGLPCFQYTGTLPYEEYLENGQKVKLPEDPWFLLGNYQLTVFTHVSGEYELITGQRSWGRVNQGKHKNSGINRAELTINGKTYRLAGMDSLSIDPLKCVRSFGCGFADYAYEIDGVKVSRRLSVKPSTNPYDGASAMLCEVMLTNTSDKEAAIRYEEGVTANYKEIQYQQAPEGTGKVQYTYEAYEEAEKNTVGVQIKAHYTDPMLCAKREDISLFEGFPPCLFIAGISNAKVAVNSERELVGTYAGKLMQEESICLQMIIGYSFEYGVSNLIDIRRDLSTYVSGKQEKIQSAYANEWLNALPAFENEKDEALRNELRWHAYSLEAMATYSEFYQETKIPQGTCYDYSWGVHASARDNFQHALPLVYYNPALAKSVIRYILKRTTPFGEIRLIEKGNAYADNERYFTSDQQLYCLLLITEYLRVTKDYELLHEKVAPYPVTGQREMTILEFVQKIYLFLRDTVNVGPHGLVRLLNSDWNDTVYYVLKVPYNTVVLDGESHMNSAMAISILQALTPVLREISGKESFAGEQAVIGTLCNSMEVYRKDILDAFLKDMGERAFPRRMYFAGKPYGEENMFLEPQGFTLQIRELSLEQKQTLYSEMQKRVYDGEKLGAREQQTPEFEDDHYEKGSRENGGFWWALNGPVIVAVNEFNHEEAVRLLQNMSFGNYAKQFPKYWSSYWSAADNVESSLIIEEGLPDQSEDYSCIPIYCAHPHAWMVYCYYKINE
ncbi:MAG: hypothetical protein IJD96_03510 [Lachnospiraceae bacterium]|nr:hypothetical protein [Lachnospiraceae bacterium]